MNLNEDTPTRQALAAWVAYARLLSAIVDEADVRSAIETLRDESPEQADIVEDGLYSSALLDHNTDHESSESGKRTARREVEQDGEGA